MYIKKLEYLKCEKLMKMYMYCKHVYCKKFKLIILYTDEEAIVEVHSTSIHFSHQPESRYTTQVRGDERKIVGEIMKEKSAFKYRQECILSASPVKLKMCGNLQSIKSPAMLRKLKSEQLLKGDFNQDDYLDMILMAEKHPWLNMKVQNPFNVIWSSQHQLAIIKNLSKKCEITTIHVDSTGTVVRPPQNSIRTTIYYYACVIRIGKIETVCPITDMVSATHDRDTVYKWLTWLKDLVVQEEPSLWPPFKNVVTDFSWAFMHGISKAWNGKETIFEYLDMCHRILTNIQTMPTNIIIVNSCTNHYVKNIVNHTKTYFSDDFQIAYCISRYVGLVFEMTKYEEIKQWFKLLAIILLSKKLTVLCVRAKSEMQSKLQDKNQLIENAIEQLDDVFDCPKDSYYAERKKSAFYYDFVQILDSAKIEVNSFTPFCDNLEINSMYSEEFLMHFLIENVPYIPLWTRVMTTLVNINERQSNASVESWFNMVKNNILTGQKRMKCGRFVEMITKYEANCFRQVELQIPKRLCAIQSRRDNCDNELHLNTPEFWQKKGRRPACLRNLNRVLATSNVAPQKSSTLTFDEQSDDVLIEKTGELTNSAVSCQYPSSQCDNLYSKIDVTDDSKTLQINNEISPCRKSLITDVIPSIPAVVCGTKPVVSDEYDACERSYGHAVVWEPSHENSPTGKYNLYRTSKLVKDSTYYMQCYRGIEKYVVARVCFGNEEVEITSLDFKRLNTLGSPNTLWLQNTEIWCLLQIFKERNLRTWVTKKKVQLDCVSPDQSYYMFNLCRSIENSVAERPDWIDSSCLIIPLLEYNHWTMVYVDFIKKTVSYLNSIKTVHNDPDKRNYWKNKVLDVLNSVPDKWNPKQKIGDLYKWQDLYIDIPYQGDEYNCVFMLYFAKQLMSNKRIIDDFNPNCFRKMLQDMILSRSICMKNNCLICGKDEGSFRQNYRDNVSEDNTMVQCDSCTRWIHILCLPTNEKTHSDSYWICGLCLSN